MTWRRREDGGENPAWPGLVDIFAFTMVFIMLLWFGLEKENQNLRAEKGTLEKRLADLEHGGLKKLSDLANQLNDWTKQESMQVKLNPKGLEIEIPLEPKMTFKTGKYELSKFDEIRLVKLAPRLFEVTKEEEFFVIINGTADPQDLLRTTPPRNNSELSALRAATVVTLLENAAPGLGQHLRVVGLGVKGQEVTLAPGDDPEKVFEEYRSVSLLIKLDMAASVKRLNRNK